MAEAAAVKAAVEKLAALLEPGPEAAPATADVGGLAAAAKRARDAYQRTIRWVLGAFGVVGLLIFGSVPFADINEVELTSADGVRLLAGLGAAAVGIAVAVWAVSTVLEPEDASLAELDSQLTGASARSWNPRVKSRVELTDILTGPEKEAHLGPGIGTVAALIAKIGELEGTALERAPAAGAAALAVTVAEARLTAAADELTLLQAAVDAAGKLPDTDPDRPAVLGRAVAAAAVAAGALTARRAALDAALDALAAAREPVVRNDVPRETYGFHRALLLTESAVMQMRGTFRLARLLLTGAAVLTLVGGVLYASALPGADAGGGSEPVRRIAVPATVRVNPGSTAAKHLDAACLDRDLAALYTGGSVPPRTGPFTATITAPAACAGQLTVGADEGSLTLRLPG
jgi:hypothetical protein